MNVGLRCCLRGDIGALIVAQLIMLVPNVDLFIDDAMVKLMIARDECYRFLSQLLTVRYSVFDTVVNVSSKNADIVYGVAIKQEQL